MENPMNFLQLPYKLKIIKDVQTVMAASQDKKHVVRMSRPLQRQNYKVIWAY